MNEYSHKPRSPVTQQAERIGCEFNGLIQLDGQPAAIYKGLALRVLGVLTAMMWLIFLAELTDASASPDPGKNVVTF